MTQKQLLFPVKDVNKHNQLIQNKVNLPSSIGQRILATLIAHIDPTQKAPALTCKVEAKELLRSTGGKNYKDLKIAISEMAKATVELEFLGENEEENDLYFYPFFAYIRYKDGYISAEFNYKLKDLLILAFEKGNFTKYNLLEFYMLKSIYSQRMYEILKSYSFHRDGFKNFSLNELHELLNTPESLRNNYKAFRVRVLEPAFKEITEKTLFTYEYEPIRKGTGKTSPVIGISFIFSRKKVLPITTEKTNKKQGTNSKKQVEFLRKALDCAKQKRGICKKRDNQQDVCNFCLQLKIFDEIKSKIDKGMIDL